MSRNGADTPRALGFAHQRRPDFLHSALQLRERSIVFDDVVGARALELSGHLGGDHVHRLGLEQLAILDQALEPHGTARVHEHDPVELAGHVSLEEQWDVADHDLVFARSRLFDQPDPESLDLGMDDLVKFFQLRVIGEDDAAQRGAIEMAVGGNDLGSPSGHDLAVSGGADLDGAAGKDIGVDDRCAALREHLRDRRFAAADVSGESYQEHDGFLGWVRSLLRPDGPSIRGATGPVNDENGAKRAMGDGVSLSLEERNQTDRADDEFRQLVRRQLELLGEDPDREGLIRTPQRVAKALAWLTRGYEMDVEHVVGNGIFDAEHATNMVMVRDIELYSLCEHHMLPFYGKAHVAYIPDGKIVGLSKLPRIVEVFARRLQVQERMTEQIATALDDVLKPQGVGVIIEAYHLCMMMRGVEKQNSKTITSAVRGLFRSDPRTREEFLTLAYAPER